MTGKIYLHRWEPTCSWDGLKRPPSMYVSAWISKLEMRKLLQLLLLGNLVILAMRSATSNFSILEQSLCLEVTVEGIFIASIAPSVCHLRRLSTILVISVLGCSWTSSVVISQGRTAAVRVTSPEIGCCWINILSPNFFAVWQKCFRNRSHFWSRENIYP